MACGRESRMCSGHGAVCLPVFCGISDGAGCRLLKYAANYVFTALGLCLYVY